MSKIKFCGITRLEDAKVALELGVDALGFNFYQKSPRYLSPLDAQVLIRSLPATAWRVGVFVNHKKEEVEQIARTASLDTLQFHGDETAEFCAEFSEWRVVKAIRLNPETSKNKIESYKNVSEHLLYDAFSKAKYGGTGKQIEPELLAGIDLSNAFLSGGITPDNVSELVKTYKPQFVDVASGIETSPGVKSKELMQRFVEVVNAKESL